MGLAIRILGVENFVEKSGNGGVLLGKRVLKSGWGLEALELTVRGRGFGRVIIWGNLLF